MKDNPHKWKHIIFKCIDSYFGKITSEHGVTITVKYSDKLSSLAAKNNAPVRNDEIIAKQKHPEHKMLYFLIYALNGICESYRQNLMYLYTCSFQFDDVYFLVEPTIHRVGQKDLFRDKPGNKVLNSEGNKAYIKANRVTDEQIRKASALRAKLSMVKTFNNKK